MFFGCTICFSMNFPSQILTAEGAIGIVPEIDEKNPVSPSDEKTVSVMPRHGLIFKPVGVSAETRRAYSGCFFQV